MTLNMLKISIEFRFYIIFHFIHVKNVEKTFMENSMKIHMKSEHIT